MYANDKELWETSAKFKAVMPYLYNCENAVAKLTTDGWVVRALREGDGDDGYVGIKGDPQTRSLDTDAPVGEPFEEWIQKQVYQIGKPVSLVNHIKR